MKFHTLSELRIEDVRSLLSQDWLQYDQHKGFYINLIKLFDELSEIEKIDIISHFEFNNRQEVKDKFWPFGRT